MYELKEVPRQTKNPKVNSKMSLCEIRHVSNFWLYVATDRETLAGRTKQGLSFQPIRPSLELKTWPKNLDYLLLDIALLV